MRPIERMLCTGLALATCGGIAARAWADPSGYGKVDTFQPGKKYNCVPTADRKGWNCAEAGKAATRPPAAKPASASSAAPVHPTTPAATAQPHAGALPDYLTNAAAAGPMQPMPAVPAPKPLPRPPVRGPRMNSAVPASAATPPARPVSTSAPTVAASSSVADFLDLPVDAYVIVLAHGDSMAGVATAAPVGADTYDLHLRQNDADVWLRVCGPYDDLEAARNARDDLAAQGFAPGWPRRIGPLQTEVRRGTSE